jgi:hypothetical protein
MAGKTPRKPLIPADARDAGMPVRFVDAKPGKRKGKA